MVGTRPSFEREVHSTLCEFKKSYVLYFFVLYTTYIHVLQIFEKTFLPCKPGKPNKRGNPCNYNDLHTLVIFEKPLVNTNDYNSSCFFISNFLLFLLFTIRLQITPLYPLH
jgi:hypothetical protein